MVSHFVGSVLTILILSNISYGAVRTIQQQPEIPQSPCPGIFSYENNTTRSSQSSRWYGNIHISTDVTLYGVWIDVVLDRQAISIGNWFGDVESSDNTEFKIQNTKHILTPGSPTTIRIYVVYDPTPPKVKVIRLNGRDICSTATTSQFNPTPLSQNSNKRVDSREDFDYRPKETVRDTVNNERVPTNQYNPTINTGTQTGNQNSNGYGVDSNNYYTTSSTYSPYNNNAYDASAGVNKNSGRDQGSSISNQGSNVYNQGSSSWDRGVNVNNQDSKKTTSSVPDINYNSNRENTNYNSYSENNNKESENSYNRPIPTRKPYNNGNNNEAEYRPSTLNSQRQTTSRPSSTRREVYSRPDEYSTPTERSTPGYQTEFTYRPKTTKRPSRRPSYDSEYDTDDYTNGDSNKKKNKNDPGNNDYFEGDHRLPSSEKISPTRDPQIFRESNDDEESCGKVAVKPAPLIVNGQATEHGQWPWHVAIYQSQTVDSKYICGGSLISLNHVVTAAHCVTRKNTARVVNVATLAIYLGKFNLRTFTDGVQIMIVRKIYVHPEYNATNFYADLSILKFTKPAEYTTFVRPVCVWKDDETSLSNVIGKEGSVVGWGFDEESHVTEELSLVKMPVVEQATCLWSFKEFYTHFTSNHSYCAGYANGTSVCNGDSGGGMVFADDSYSSSPTWRLRGLVSISVARQNEYVCDPFHYVVFTDTAQFLPWIKRILSL